MSEFLIIPGYLDGKMVDFIEFNGQRLAMLVPGVSKDEVESLLSTLVDTAETDVYFDDDIEGAVEEAVDKAKKEMKNELIEFIEGLS